MSQDQRKERSNVVLFLSGKFVSLLGSQMYGFAMGLYILRMTGSGMSFAINILLSTIPALIFSPLAGSLADRKNRKKIVVGADLLSGVIMLIVFTITMNVGLKVGLVYLSTFLLRSVSIFFNVTFDAAMPNLVRKEKIGQIQSLSQAATQGTSILGPVFGAMLYAIISPQLFLLANGISFVCSGISEMFIDFYWRVAPAEAKSEEDHGYFASIKEGYSYMAKNPMMKAMIRNIIGINFFFSVIGIMIPVVLVRDLQLSSQQFGITEALFSIGALIWSIKLSQQADEDVTLLGYSKKMIWLPLLTLAMGFAVIPGIGILQTIPPVVYYGILAFTMGACLMAVNIPMMVYIQKNTEDENRGRVMGFLNMIAMLISPLGYLLHGYLSDVLPSYILFVYAGLATLVLVGDLYRSGIRLERGSVTYEAKIETEI
ncbi:MFS transporter [Gottschalkiaceae bacterium SANA]|nr:MFS transporter [Gottschalkiaceae bacterium SANA]